MEVKVKGQEANYDKGKYGTVVGANGTMGRNISAIFASFGNAKVYMISRDIKKSEQAKEKVYQSVRAESVKGNMIPADYTMLEECILESDIIFESAAENWDIKSTITASIADVAKKNMLMNVVIKFFAQAHQVCQ